MTNDRALDSITIADVLDKDHAMASVKLRVLMAKCQLHWWEPVFCQANAVCPSESREQRGTWAGVAKTQGGILAHLVLTDDAQQVIACSKTTGTPPGTSGNQWSRAESWIVFT
jgi:hypothetical protein